MDNYAKFSVLPFPLSFGSSLFLVYWKAPRNMLILSTTVFPKLFLTPAPFYLSTLLSLFLLKLAIPTPHSHPFPSSGPMSSTTSVGLSGLIKC